jgi:hypothetical protein
MPAKKKISKKVASQQSSRIICAASLLFAGICVTLIGNWQDNERLGLLLVGFGAALLVVGGAVSFMATRVK